MSHDGWASAYREFSSKIGSRNLGLNENQIKYQVTTKRNPFVLYESKAFIVGLIYLEKLNRYLVY